MKKIKKLKNDKYLSTETIVHNSKLLSKMLTENEIEQGIWTPTLLNCEYTTSCNYGKYTKIGKMVTVWFHIRTSITELKDDGRAIIIGLPYRPTWPQRSWKC